MQSYKVHFTYSPKYNPDMAKTDHVFWQWSKKPVLWEDYEQVRSYVKERYGACCVLIYAVVPATVLELVPDVTPASFLRNYNKKTKLYEPWRIHDQVDRRAG